jgi:ABC-type sugar transport system ATPase subunit
MRAPPRSSTIGDEPPAADLTPLTMTGEQLSPSQPRQERAHASQIRTHRRTPAGDRRAPAAEDLPGRRRSRQGHRLSGCRRGGVRPARPQRRRQVDHDRDAHDHDRPNRGQRARGLFRCRARADRRPPRQQRRLSGRGRRPRPDRPAQSRHHSRLWRVDPGAARDRIGELAETLGLAKLLDRPVAGYSGGERRRLEIARALVSQPQVLSWTSRRSASTRASATSCSR